MLASMLVLAATGVDPVPDTVTGKSGLPQLNVIDFAPQLFWLALSFAALYVLLARVVIPRIESVIDDRRTRIQHDLDAAERLKTETEKALAAYEEAYAAARSKASDIAKRTHEALAADVEAERSRVEAQVVARIAEAEARIGETKAKAMAHVNEIASETAEAIVARLIGQDRRVAAKAEAGE